MQPDPEIRRQWKSHLHEAPEALAGLTLSQRLQATTPPDEVEQQRALHTRMLDSHALSGQPMTSHQQRLRAEAVGEVGAAQALRDHPDLAVRYADYRLVQGFEHSRAQGFDQVYVHPSTGDVLIVEAKGGASRQGHTVSRGNQMSQQWVDGVAAKMPGPAAHAIHRARAEGRNIEGIFISTPTKFCAQGPFIVGGEKLRGVSNYDPSGVISYHRSQDGPVK